MARARWASAGAARGKRSLSFQVIIDRGNHPNSLHDAGIGRGVSRLLTLAAGLICRQDRKDSLVSLTNRANLAPRISGEPVSSGARVASGFCNHVRLDGVEAS